MVGSGVNVRLETGQIAEAHVALASVAPTPLYVREITDALRGQPATPDTLATAAKLASDACRPITDMRGTIEYRKHLAGVLTRRALEAAILHAGQRSAAH